MKAACLFLFLLVSLSGTAHAQRPLRVLIDASKDGGLWWFPQGNTFDPAQHHQGKPLADFMRSKGWQVVELPRGEVITFEKLRRVDVVVRPPAYFRYSVSEVEAYRDSVIAGTRLLLMGGSVSGSDPIAEIFGLRFEPRTRFGSVRQWIPHPLTTDIQKRDLSWIAISEAPTTAVQLAWLNQSETNSQPVLGYLTHGDGYVVFVGQSLITLPPFFASLVSSLGQYNLAELRQVPMTGPVMPLESSAFSSPRLLTPEPDATLPQLNLGVWQFDWEDDPLAASYQIVVLGPSAAFPLATGMTAKSEYVVPARSGFVADHNLLGWSWRVRSRYPNGAWSPWSRVRRFNVAPRARP